MRQIIGGKLYDTELSEIVHTYDFHYRMDEDGEIITYPQVLYLSPGGKFFYVYYHPTGDPLVKVIGGEGCLFTKSWRPTSKDEDDIDRAIRWMESHGGTEAILERWPERIYTG